MPRPASIVAVVAIAAAAAGSVVRCWLAVGSFDAAAIAGDPASAKRRKFEALRAALPPGASVRVVSDERELAPAELAVVDAFAAALHRRLTTGSNEPVPGFEQDYVRQVAEGFVGKYPPEQNRDAAAVRANLIEWWTALASGMQLCVTQFGLAPHLVRPAAATDWVVGDFSPGFDHRALAARRQLTVVTDFGGGAVLFRAAK